jgi:hypothetical protein
VKAGSDGKTKTIDDYKARISVDEGDYIKAMELTAGNVHDSQCFTKLLSEKESEVFTGSGLRKPKNEQMAEVTKE